MTTILVVEGDVSARDAVRVALSSVGHKVVSVGSPRQALEELSRTEVDVLLASVTANEAAGLGLCEHVVAHRPDVPVIVMTADDDLDFAIAAIRAGAYDYLRTPASHGALIASIERAIRRRSLLRKINIVEGTKLHEEPGVVAESPRMQRVLEVVHRMASTEASLIIAGASGTGKEVIARTLHRHSPRCDQPFVSFSCAALREDDLVSCIQQAHRGTIFLDGIGDMSLALQPKLLHALQARAIRPVGAKIEVPVDVRVVASTDHDLAREVAQKTFRADLFFRLNVVEVTLPTLADRGTDVILLARHFLADLAVRAAQPVRTLSPAAVAMLLAYDWPGNVRELQNCMERAVALGQFDAIGPDDLPNAIREHGVRLLQTSSDDHEVVTLREVERRYVARVVAMVNGNKSVAARLLGIDRKTLYRKLELADEGGPRKPS